MRGEDGANGLCRMHVQVNAVKYESEQLSIFPGISCFQKNLPPMDLNPSRDSVSDVMEQTFAAGNVGMAFPFTSVLPVAAPVQSACHL